MVTAQISLEEYFHTSYRPDCDYVDGEVQERNFGGFDHAAAQACVGSWFFQHRHDWHLHVLPEIRIRVSATRVRIADLSLIERGDTIEQVPTKPPLTVIEITSPEDRISRYNERLGDYRRMGIQHIWVIAPANRTAYDCSTAAWLPVDEVRVAGTPIFLRFGELWTELESSR